jgi:hypothetical protein
MPRRLLAVAGCAVLALLSGSGCGTYSPARATASSSPPAASVSPATVAQSTSSRQRAEADVAAILALFVPPPGARKLAAAPGASGGVLSQMQLKPVTPDLVDDAGWWRVPDRAPQAVLSWEASHVPRRLAPGAYGGVGATFDSWSLPSVGVLDSRWLVVTVVSDGAGGTDLRVEGEDVYSPDRPAWSYIPATAVRSVLVAAVPSPNDHRKPPAALLVTDPGTVRRLVALVNAATVPPAGARSCPAYDGGGVRLTFLSGAGGGKAANGPVLKTAVLAVALAMNSGCGGVDVTVAGAQAGLGQGPSVAEQALAISGLRWTFYRYGP